MGQAKHRGTFEQRKTEAIERDIERQRIMAKYDREYPIKPSGMSTEAKLFLAMAIIEAERLKKLRWFR